ncbi:MAG: DUF2071 domain-containing protein [Candidatus Tectomicrobia bacterium]|nr:DUF2071 domain-containing protein [Candidatus Tectomicrobia bacterium]
MDRSTRFLAAEWRYLAMLNYEIDPAALAPYVPYGSELDSWNGKMFVSIVGFLFLRTKLFGIPIPFHCNFEEVNLRFYVRRKGEDGWRRGVVFIKEIVPRIAIAAVARTLYNENYVAMRMRHTLDLEGEALRKDGSVEYAWFHHGEWNRLSVRSSGESLPAAAGSEEEFITEHYWGYAAQRDGGCVEYRVEHPSWRIWKVSQAELHCDVLELYGPEFTECLSAQPGSAFLADGSQVIVHKGIRL